VKIIKNPEVVSIAANFATLVTGKENPVTLLTLIWWPQTPRGHSSSSSAPGPTGSVVNAVALSMYRKKRVYIYMGLFFTCIRRKLCFKLTDLGIKNLSYGRKEREPKCVLNNHLLQSIWET
jgi:hypothetical protein